MEIAEVTLVDAKLTIKDKKDIRDENTRLRNPEWHQAQVRRRVAAIVRRRIQSFH